MTNVGGRGPDGVVHDLHPVSDRTSCGQRVTAAWRVAYDPTGCSLCLWARGAAVPRRSMPPSNRTDTSRAAAESMVESAASLRVQIRSMVRAAGDNGLTCDEIEANTGWRHQTASARIKELSDVAALVDSGRRRATRSGRLAIVWIGL